MQITYLTDKIKDGFLKDLQEQKQRGNIDERWLLNLDKLNQLPGVVTMECCQGHKRVHTVHNGYISFLLGKPQALVFEKTILPKLMKSKYVLSVRFSYVQRDDGGRGYSPELVDLFRTPSVYFEIHFPYDLFDRFIEKVLDGILIKDLKGEKDDQT